MSWTLDREKAIWFAQRFPEFGAQPICLQATVKKENVFAYFGDCEESEIVVRPGRVSRVRPISLDGA